jgi:hypothetical protein
MLSNFIQVLNNARDVYTQNHYFSNSKLFSRISLLQKQRLNPRNYSKQEIIMKLFCISYWQWYAHACKNSEHYKV